MKAKDTYKTDHTHTHATHNTHIHNTHNVLVKRGIERIRQPWDHKFVIARKTLDHLLHDGIAAIPKSEKDTVGVQEKGLFNPSNSKETHWPVQCKTNETKHNTQLTAHTTKFTHRSIMRLMNFTIKYGRFDASFAEIQRCMRSNTDSEPPLCPDYKRRRGGRRGGKRGKRGRRSGRRKRKR